MNHVKLRIVALAALVASLLSCAAVLALLPKVIAAVQIAEQAINAVQTFADGKVTDQALRDKIDAAANVARAALTVATNAAKGSGELATKDVRAAFDDFATAYQALLNLAAPLGVTPQETPKMSASPGKLTVPSPAVLRAEMDPGDA
jgi:hypothetical protein